MKRYSCKRIGRPPVHILRDGTSAREYARSVGVSDKAFDSRLHGGWSPEQAAGFMPPPSGPRLQPRKRRMLSDGRSALHVALQNGIERGAFYSRVRIGWSPEQAAGLVPRDPAISKP